MIHNSILTHVYLKSFSVFLSHLVCICIQNLEKMKRRETNFFFKNSIMGFKKRRISRWFQIRWKSVTKLYRKKVLANVTEMCTFSTFTHVHQTCFFIPFFGAFLKKFQLIWNQHEILRFLTPFLIENFFCHISTFFKLCSQNAQNTAPKIKKTCEVNVS